MSSSAIARPRRWLHDPSLAAPAAVAIMALLLALIISRHGMLLTPDSIVYLGAARNTGHGHWFTIPFTTYTSDVPPLDAVRFKGAVPLTDYPPLVPAALGSLVPFGVDPATTARYLYAVLLGATMLLLGLLGRALLGVRRWGWVVGVQLCALFGPLLAFNRLPFLTLHTAVLSEPLMLATGLASLWLLVLHLRDGRSSMFWWSVGFASAATLCRFAGVANVFTVVLVVLVAKGLTLRTRAIRAAAALAAGLGPTAVVTLVAQARLGRSARATQVMNLAAMPGEMARGLSNIIWPVTWSSGVRYAAGAFVMVALAVSLVTWLRVRPLPIGDAAPALLVLGGFTVVYSLVLAGARGFFDRNIPLDGRMLAGVLGPLLLLLAYGLSRRPLRSPTGLLGATAGLLVLAILAGPAVNSLGSLLGSGYARSPANRRDIAKLRGAVDAVPGRPVIFSNLPDSVYEATRRPTYMVPCRTDYFAQQPNPEYRQQVDDLLALVRDGKALLAMSPVTNIRKGCLSGEELPTGLTVVASFPGGSVYGIR